MILLDGAIDASERVSSHLIRIAHSEPPFIHLLEDIGIIHQFNAIISTGASLRLIMWHIITILITGRGY